MHIGEWCLQEETGRSLTSLSVFSLHRPTSPSQETTSSIVQVSTSFRRCSNASRASKPSCHRGTGNASETAGDGEKKNGRRVVEPHAWAQNYHGVAQRGPTMSLETGDRRAISGVALGRHSMALGRCVHPMPEHARVRHAVPPWYHT